MFATSKKGRIMSVAVPQQGEIFIFRTFKAHINNQDGLFTNVYEFQMTSPAPDTSHLETLGNRIADFEKLMTTSDIIHDRFIVSQWTPTAGYDPYDMMSVATGGVGLISDYSTTLPLEACMHIRKSTQTGRQGKLLMRGALKENQVESVAGDWILTDTAQRDTELQAALATSELDGYIGALAPNELQMVMHGVVKSGAVYTRPVTGLSVAGVTWAKMTRRWYNRKPPGA
jgi:hypothetical protein